MLSLRQFLRRIFKLPSLSFLTWCISLSPLLASIIAVLLFGLDILDYGGWKFIGFLDLAAIVFIIVWRVPKLQSPRTWDTKAKFEIENEARKTILQVLGGLSVLLTLYSVVQTSANTERALELSQSANLADRFTKAVEQLGALDATGQKRIEVRLGAIYALEAIAKQASDYHWQIMEVLTGYLRQNARRTEHLEKSLTCATIRANRLSRAKHPFQITSSGDIQAIVTVIARRIQSQDAEPVKSTVSSTVPFFFRRLVILFIPPSYSIATGRSLDLRGVDLRGTLIGAGPRDFESANFSLSDLRGIRWTGVEMHEARFNDSWLDEADLSVSNLDNAEFVGTSLRGAVLEGEGGGEQMDLRSADFREADLRCADIVADLEGAHLEGAHLEGSRLKNADGESAVSVRQIMSACIDEETVLPVNAARRPRPSGPCR